MQAKIKKIIWGIAFGISGYFSFYYLLIGPAVLPLGFQDARISGADLAEQITSLSNKSLENLNEISKYDASLNYSEALALVSRALIDSKEASDLAVDLSTQLALMAQKIADIRPAKGREIASEAITYEVALVSRLINYNANLKELFEVLRGKFLGNLPSSDVRVEKLLNEINESTRVINGLNKAFNDALVRFDVIYK
jgi:hypothetical protein